MVQHIWCEAYSLFLSFFKWNPSNPDTNGPEESVLIREVKSTQTWYLGKKKVS